MEYQSDGTYTTTHSRSTHDMTDIDDIPGAASQSRPYLADRPDVPRRWMESYEWTSQRPSPTTIRVRLFTALPPSSEGVLLGVRWAPSRDRCRTWWLHSAWWDLELTDLRSLRYLWRAWEINGLFNSSPIKSIGRLVLSILQTETQK